MTTGRKILWVLMAAGLSAVLALAAGVIYLRGHPEALKPLTEKAVYHFFGWQAEAAILHYSLSPLGIDLRDVTLAHATPSGRLQVEIPRLCAALALEGSFGRRRLVVKSFLVERPSAEILGEPPRLGGQGSTPPAAWFRRFAARAFAYLIFEEIHVEQAALAGGSLEWCGSEGTLRLADVAARLDAGGDLQLTLRLRGGTDSGDAGFDCPAVQVDVPDATPVRGEGLMATVCVPAGSFYAPGAEGHAMTLRASLRYLPAEGCVRIETFELRAADFRGQGGGWVWGAPFSITLPEGAVVDLEGGQGEICSVVLQAGDAFFVQGRLKAVFGGDREVLLEDLQGSIGLGALQAALNPPAVELPAFVKGAVHWGGFLRGRGVGGPWRWFPRVTVDWDGVEFSGGARSARFSGRLAGCAALDGQLPDVRVAAEVNGTYITVEAPEVKTSAAAFRLAVGGTYPLFEIHNLNLAVPRLETEIGAKKIRLEPLRVNGTGGTFDLLEGRLALPNLAVALSRLTGLRASLEAQRNGFQARLTGEGLEPWAAAADAGLVPEGWRVGGRDVLSLDLSLDPAGRLNGDFQWRTEGLRFQSPGGVLMGAGIRAHARLRFNGDVGGGGMSVAGDAALETGEALYDRFYLDFGRNALSIVLRTDYALRDGALHVAKGDLRLKDLGSVAFSGQLKGLPAALVGRLSFAVPEIPLEPLVRTFLKEPFQDSIPQLRELEAGGGLGLHLDLSLGGAGWRVRGLGAWRGGSLRLNSSTLDMEGIELLFPLWAERGRPEGDSGAEPMKGRLRIGRLNLPQIAAQDLSWELTAGPGTLLASSGKTLPFGGGTLQLGAVRLEGLYGSDFNLATSLKVHGIRMSALLGGYWPRPVEGTLNGRLALVQLKGGSLVSEGDLTAGLFGGEWVIDGIAARGLLTAAPTLRLNARWKNVDLGLLTAQTSFGKVEGVLEGRVQGLEVAAGQPQAFDLLMETVPESGVPQRISVKAVDSIASIGGGQSPFLGLAGGVAALFREFPYSQIGVHATLENDQFRINGTIHEGGREYLVKRRGLLGVNVVNQNPGGRIGFKDMVKRIKRIKSTEGGPVIQ